MILESQRKKLILRRLCLALILLALSVIQNTDGFFPQIFGVRALLLIPAVVCIAMYERDIWGLILGLFAGALWDITASGASFNALYFMTVGFLCGTLINTIMRNNVITAMILSTIATVMYNVGHWFFSFIARNIENAPFMFFRYYLPSIFYTMLFIPVTFFIVLGIEKKFSIDN